MMWKRLSLQTRYLRYLLARWISGEHYVVLSGALYSELLRDAMVLRGEHRRMTRLVVRDSIFGPSRAQAYKQ